MSATEGIVAALKVWTSRPAGNRIAQCQSVDHGSEHAHEVRRHPIRSVGSAGHPTEDIAPTHHNRHLHTRTGDFCDLALYALEIGRFDTERVVACQRFAETLSRMRLYAATWHYLVWRKRIGAESSQVRATLWQNQRR